MAADFYKLKRAKAASGKKWAVKVPSKGGGRTVRFGALGYQDYTQHKDKKRRDNYRSRHRNDNIDDPYSAGFWSWWVLWGHSTDRGKNFKTAVGRAKRILAKKNPVHLDEHVLESARFLEGRLGEDGSVGALLDAGVPAPDAVLATAAAHAEGAHKKTRARDRLSRFPQRKGETWSYEDLIHARNNPARNNPVAARHRQDLRDVAQVERGRTYAKGKRTLLDLSRTKVEWVGCVVNPKTMRPYFVLRRSIRDGFLLCVPSTDLTAVEAVGAAYFESETGSDYAAPAVGTGYPRIHTPQGVADRGTGLGTALYTAGALTGAYFVVGEREGEVASRIDAEMLENEGCSSGHGASKAAQRWWRRAQRAGLAEDLVSAIRTPVEDDERVSVEIDMPIDLAVMLQFPSEPLLILFKEYLSEGAEHFAREEAGVEDGEVTFVEANINSRVVGVDVIVVAAVYYRGKKVKIRKDINLDLHLHEGFSGSDLEDLIAVKVASVEINDEDLETIEEKTGEPVGYSDIEYTELRYIKSFRPATIDVSGEAVYDVTSLSETSREETVYVYPFDNALNNSLVLDFTEVLRDDYGHELDTGLLPVVLNLDLGEIEDPEVFAFFFGLAEHLGATRGQLQRFKNSVLAYRGDMPASLADRETFDPEAGFGAELKKKGYRVNPDRQKHYRRVGKKLFGPLADLE